MALYDMHAHLGFLREGAEENLPSDLRFLNATVTPEEYDRAQERFAKCENVRTAAGLHPWYVAADTDADAARTQAAALCEHIRPAMAVGEVGLDFSPRHAHTRDAQVAAFDAVVRAAAAAGECVLTLHSVQATATVLDTLAQTKFFARGRVIFHWYSGSSEHLHEALRAGAYFSINPRMLETRRGREYARIIPANRLLVETDFPAEDGTLPAPFVETLSNTLARMAQLRGADPLELAARVEENSRGLWDAL